MFVLLSRGRGFEESPRVDQVVWGFKITACGPLHLWGIEFPVEMVDMDKAGPGIVKRA